MNAANHRQSMGFSLHNLSVIERLFSHLGVRRYFNLLLICWLLPIEASAAAALSPASQTVNGTVGTAITATTAFTATNFTGDVVYSLDSRLPPGLSLDTDTGVISGTPTEAQSATTYTVTGEDRSGNSATATVSITVAAVPAALSPASQTVNGTVGTAITATTAFTATNFTGDVVYSLDSRLPPGLSLDTDTGVISGTPTEAQSATTYTVTGEDRSGNSATATVSITVAAVPAALSPASQTVNGTVGTAITATTAFTATNFTGDVVYSLDSRLPPGLSLDTDTGVISGTPTEAQSATTYTVTGEDRSGNSATATVSITVAAVPAALSPASQTVNGTVGTAITATTAFTATNFTGDVVYSLDSRLPPGLSLDTDTGVISGTPTEAQSATTYTVTGEDRSGNSATATVSITVAAVPAALSPASQTVNGTVGTAITATTAFTATNFTGDVVYSLDSRLPPGLSLDTDTGVISGTPTEAQSATTYTVTGEDRSGNSATATVSITVAAVPAALSPASQTVNGTVGTAITATTAFTATNFTGDVVYSLDSRLPPGLSLDTDTGVISGTPTEAQSATTYTVTGEDRSGNSATATVSITVAAVPAALSPASQTVNGTVGTAITATTAFTATNFTGDVVYSLDSRLPPGLSLDTDTGVISGTPTEAQSATTYTVTGEDRSGNSATATVSITVAAVPAALSPASQTVNGTVGTAITATTAFTATNFTGDVVYSLDSRLPPGLSLDTDTGVISGTPTEAQSATTYTVTGEDRSGNSATATVSITVAAVPAALSPASQTVNGTVGTAITATTAFTATNFTGDVVYSLDSRLPPGLSLDTDTGVISGTPTEAQSATTYTVTGEDRSGNSATATVSITVAAVPAALSPASQTVNGTVGTAITATTAFTATNFTGDVVYSLDSRLPPGLSLDTDTGVISGTPTEAQSATTYTVTGEDRSGNSATATVSITVAAVPAALSPASQTVNGTVGTAITATTAFTATNFTGDVVYSLDSRLPPGLSLDTDTGVISGTPTEAQSATTYTVTGEDRSGNSATATVSITVAAVPAALSPASQTVNGTVGTAITATTAFTATNFTGDVVYSLDSRLPPGLSLDTDTGVISGTPTEAQSATTYTVTGEDRSGNSATATVSITVAAVPAALSPASQTVNGTVGTAITATTAFTATNFTGDVVYSLDSRLPPGLSLDTDTGVISGTPTEAQSATTYTVTGEDRSGNSATATVSITVAAVPAALSPASQTVNGTVGTAITATTAFTATNFTGDVVYSLDSRLPPGLSLDTDTGVISGTPTEAQSATTYTVTGEDRSGNSATATVSITVAAVPAALSPASQTVNGTVGTAITATTAFTATNFTGDVVYSLDSRLPPGLSLDTDTGVISGTPTEAQSATTYTVTGEDRSGNSATATVSITVAAVPAALSPASQTVNGTVGTAITATTAFTATNFTGDVVYSLDSRLPPGLSLDTDTGVISGTPTEAQSATTYTVTGEDRSGNSATATVSITVAAVPAALSPASQTVNGTVGTAITATTAFTATNFTGDVVYSLDSRLPPGLSLDTDTGVISGTPTEAQSATTYTVTGEDRSGNSATATVSITVAAVPAALSPASQTVNGTVGTAITATTAFTATNFTGDVVYSLDSRLPPGLSLDTDTGVISGTPTEAQSATTYTVTGEDRSGNSATATVSITVAAVPAALSPASQTVNGTVGTAITATTAFTATNFTGDVVYSLDSRLPPGLSLDTDTGVISGTPTEAQSATTYTVTGEDRSGNSATATVSITVAAVPAALSPASQTVNGTVGTAITATTAFTATNFTGDVVYSLDSRLPPGLSLDTDTGVISGTPTEAQSATTYTVTGEDRSGNSATATVSITVAAVPAALSPASQTVNGTVGTAITATTAFTATNFTGDVVYSLDSRLPPGLSLDTDTGVISGTPTEAQSATTYTVTGEDRSGNSATATVSITVAAVPAALSPASQTVNGTVGTAITATTAFTATNFTGDVVYSLDSRLPPGLSLDTDTGVISGTPTEAQSATTYTVTGEDRSGNSATATVSITVAAVPAALSPASQTVNGTVGTAITATTAFTATNFTGDVVYSLDSRLPPGLSLDTDTGVISGTPTEAQSATTYTVTGEDRSGNSATATVSITVAAVPAALSPASQTVNGTVGTAITATTAFTATNFTGDVVYSLDSRLPPGLSLDTDTGVISGTPTEAQSATTYTVTGEDRSGNSATATVSITVAAVPAALSPASQTVNGTVGTAITATTAFTATNFTGDVVYSLDSRLPPGLSLDTDTGVISGTPTEAQSATTYTVTGEDRSGNSATATVSITVAAVPAALSPASQTVNGTVGTAITATTAFTATNFTGDVVYSLDSRLPPGLSLDTDTGVISGTPTEAQSATTYTVTGEDRSGNSATATVSITVAAVPAALSPASQTVNGTVGTAITATTAFTATNFTGDVVYSLDSRLPPGLSLDTDTGVISGTPTEAQSATTYTVTGEDRSGNSATATVSITVAAVPAALSPASQTVNGTVGTAITATTAFTATNFTGDVVYSLDSRLPPGLSLDTDTGVISGTPTEAQSATTYTVTGEDRSGNSATATVSITVAAVPAALSPASQTVNGTVGTAITATTAFTATNFTGDVVYSLDSRLPPGLSLDTDTGVISGTPTEAQSATTYTVTGEDRSGNSATATVSITVAAVPAALSPASQTVNGTVGTAITATTAFTATNFTGDVVYSLDSRLPPGLSLDTDTGVISGTPTEAQSATTYTVTGEDRSGNSATATVSITVAAVPAALSPASQTVNGTVGTAITATTAFTATNFTGDVVYSLDSRLPPGLSLDTDTGVISGTPTEAQSATTYTVTGEDRSGNSATATVSITVAAVPAALSPASQTVNGTVGTAITATTAFTATNFTGDVVYSLDSRLPPGLSLDTDTGVISGTPTEAQSATTYTVTGEDRSGNSATATVSITVAAVPAALSPASQTVNGTVGTAITATTAFTATNFTGDVVYSLDSRLPPGLSLDTDTGVISGTPTEAQSATTYTVTGEDRSGNSATATVSITVAAVPAALSPASQTVNGTVGTAITATTAFTATNFTGDVVYSLDSRLPPGLSLDTDTGVISGTPTEAQSATTYTVTGEDRSGNSATATVSITVAAVPAALSPASQTVNGTVGTAITATTAFTATNFTGDVVYSLDSRLPPGLSLDTDTGVISGTPTEAQSATTYTVTGEDRSGNSATATVSITVAAVPAVELNLTPEITRIESGDREVYLTVSVNGSADTIITRYDATCSDGTNSFNGSSSSSRVTVSGLTNGVSYTCMVTVTNGVATSRVSLISGPVTPEEIIPSGIPIWMLYQASKIKN